MEELQQKLINLDLNNDNIKKDEYSDDDLIDMNIDNNCDLKSDFKGDKFKNIQQKRKKK